MPVAVTLRLEKGAPLSYVETDANFANLRDGVNANETAAAAAAQAAVVAAELAEEAKTIAEGITSDAFSPGSLMPSARSSAPAGWLECDGTAVSRVDYAALFAAIGTAYGIGDNSTTFNLPDGRGRTFVGASPGLLGSDRPTARATGASGGTETHALTEAQLAAHAHPLSLKYDGLNAAGEKYVVAWGLSGERAEGSDGPWGSGGGNTTRNTSSAGSGAAHPNMPPFFVGTWLIKT